MDTPALFVADARTRTTLSAIATTAASPAAAGVWEALLPFCGPADLAVVAKRQLFPSQDRVFAEGSITRIDIVTGSVPSAHPLEREPITPPKEPGFSGTTITRLTPIGWPRCSSVR